MWEYTHTDELYHHGIKGMKWGVRRTPEQLGHKVRNSKKKIQGAIQKLKDKRKAKREEEERIKAEKTKASRSVKELSDAELREKINRLNMERQVLDLERQISNLSPQSQASGESFIKNIGSKVVAPALMDAGKRVLTDFANKKGRELLGLDKTDIDPMKELKKSVDELNLKKQKNELDKYFDREAKKKEQQSKEKEPKKADQPKSEPKSEPKQEKEPVYEGEVIGKGNSHRTESQKKPKSSNVIIDAQSYALGKYYVDGLFDDKVRI